ncbi:MFS transporter [Bordetella hinzii]|uniref:Transporter, major facilitator family protein n=1 Tax=Bordetella hinzii OH87 BAL007II TaxID=1331262 RepID=A0ABR4R0F1_9BORD|nr:MFS transporter [Bordetella hinzii]KCB23767.1 transporter, major facilitator family protein [Bordetella hinzii OH87 BAL007II]KCB43238.1 transporter, major facilitator family protein [Bordetella hinzii 5132]QDJ42293.1 MFS transporter [Bordetella hinzii]QDJ46861.1 MFS transporter [Bordetella hinzii]QDJ55774.1 MFS transporter [Bordetella hinzii]
MFTARSADASCPDAPLSRPAFRRFLAARFCTSLAYQIVSVAVGWQIYALTGSALDLGLIGLAQFLPMMCLTLLVGHVADRYDRRRIVAICMALEAGATLLLAAAALQGFGGKALVYLTVVVISSARAFEAPTLPTLIPAIVPREWIPRATALSASSNQIAQIAGPALGGIGYGIGAGWVYCAASVMYLFGLVSILRVRTERAPARKAPTTWRTLFAGIGFIARRRILLGTLSLDLFAVLLGGATALLPVFAKDVLDAGPWALGALRAAPAVGAALMSLALARLSLGNHVGRLLFSALFLFGLATVVFGLSTSIPLSLCALAVLGAADSVSVVVRSSLVQLNTPDEMLGRVSAVNTLFIGTSNQLGEFESGLTAALFGTVPAVVLGGLGTMAVAGLWMWWFPELRKLKSLSAPA